MRTLLHIGLPKTGSSTLQATFAAAYDTLVTQGVLYPRNPEGCHYPSHKILASEVRRTDRFGRDLRSLAPDAVALKALQGRFRAGLAEQIATTRPATLVLSAEHFADSQVVPDRLSSILDELGGTPQVAMYVRQPSKWLLSAVQQKLKASWEVRIASWRALRVLDGYRRALPGHAIEVVAFDRRCLRDGDIVADFCARFLGEVTVPRIVSGKNTSLSAESMDIIRRYRLDFHRERDNVHFPDSRALLRALENADNALNAARPRLRPGIADRIDYASRDPLTLRERTGVRFPDFDYARLERGALAEPLPPETALADMVEIDRRLQRGILEHLAGTDWAREAEARRAWLATLAAECASGLM